MSKKRKQYSSEFKDKAAIAAIQGKKPCCSWRCVTEFTQHRSTAGSGT
ncbi:hypothetical protein [Nitrosomonas sp.]|nr:hypothetical protein [Nitrosomonas sp.]